MEKSAPGKIRDLSLTYTLQLTAMSCHSGLNLKIFLMKFTNCLHFNIFLICWLSIKNRALKFSLEFGKINSKWDRHTLKGVNNDPTLFRSPKVAVYQTKTVDAAEFIILIHNH